MSRTDYTILANPKFLFSNFPIPSGHPQSHQFFFHKFLVQFFGSSLYIME